MIKGVEVLVEPPQGNRMSVALYLQNQLHKIDQLKGLVKVLRRFFRDQPAVLSDTFQFTGSLRILTLFALIDG